MNSGKIEGFCKTYQMNKPMNNQKQKKENPKHRKEFNNKVTQLNSRIK